MSKSKKAFTLIELLVVIAIIGVLATISIIALSNARSKSRDAKRVGNMKQVQTALELFFNDNGRYPTVEEWNLGTLYSTSSSATTTYLQVIPTAPTPADGDCSENENVLAYTQVESGASYSIAFCIGNTTGTITPGNKTLTPAGIIAVGGGEEECVPVCTGVCSGDDSCGGTCPDNCTGGDVCTNGTCQASAFSCGNTLTDSRDSNTYATVNINGQCWMQENLAYLPSVSPSGAGNGVDPFYFVYGYDGSSVPTAKAESNYSTYGVLYNYPSALAACPTGWHLPTDAEWLTLANNYNGTGLASLHLRPAGTSYWDADPGNDNTSGFTMLGAGMYKPSWSFFALRGRAQFWTPTNYVLVFSNSMELQTTSSNGEFEMANSVRCLADTD